MVTLYVGGRSVSWADAEKMFAETAPTQEIEFRNDAGRVIAVSAPVDDPDWVKAITPEKIKEAMKGPFLTLEEYRRQAEQP